MMTPDDPRYSDPDYQPGGGWAPEHDAHDGEDEGYDEMRQREADEA